MQPSKQVDTSGFTTDRQTRRALMAIGAHADDIELQAGGTLAKYFDRGYRIVYVLSTNNMAGTFSRLTPEGTVETRTPPWDEMMARRKKEAAAGARFFDTEPIHLDHPQRRYAQPNGTRVTVDYGAPPPEGLGEAPSGILTAHEDDAAVGQVSKLILEHQPEAVLTHGGQMADVEHFATLMLVTKGYRRAVEAGYEGMLLSWHDIGVNLLGDAYRRWDSFIDISDYWGRKLECTALHACQKPDPSRLDWPQWGPACGCRHAEVFNIIGRNCSPSQPGDFTIEIIQNA